MKVVTSFCLSSHLGSLELMVLKEVGNVVQLSGLNLCIGALQSERTRRKQKMKETCFLSTSSIQLFFC